MEPLLELCPDAPDWRLDWEAIDARFPWVRALRGCPQDPVWHAEGDVWIHTRMVVQSLVDSPTWRARPAAERALTFAACLLHDVAKPETTRTEEDGRITARHHSRKGAIQARRILWELGAAPEDRESVAHMILHHQRPFFLVERDDAERMAARISWTTRADLLAEVARADIRGRFAADQAALLENIELFEEQCRELGCSKSPMPFPSAAHRVAYFADPTRAVNAPVSPDPSCTVTVLSGLPAAGKDHWVRSEGAGLPVVSPDDARRRLGVSPADRQGRVVHACRDEAREHLRAGRDFIWNATHLSRRLRGQVLDLCHSYGAHSRIVCVEASPAAVHERNRARRDPVPRSAYERMLRRWEAPDPTEGHSVEVRRSDSVSSRSGSRRPR